MLSRLFVLVLSLALVAGCGEDKKAKTAEDAGQSMPDASEMTAAMRGSGPPGGACKQTNDCQDGYCLAVSEELSRCTRPW